ncbi:hypothetical protein B0G57_11985 [Trinickia symbiotica]|nr:hypothetical protein [Trinickia symbiotica]PPK42427.1 hypothetical protein B0G57_11985 [Trinickia symbiotica]
MRIPVTVKAIRRHAAPFIAGRLNTPVIIVILAVLAALGVLLQHYK